MLSCIDFSESFRAGSARYEVPRKRGKRTSEAAGASREKEKQSGKKMKAVEEKKGKQEGRGKKRKKGKRGRKKQGEAVRVKGSGSVS